jgi:hypothetical protein
MHQAPVDLDLGLHDLAGKAVVSPDKALQLSRVLLQGGSPSGCWM